MLFPSSLQTRFVAWANEATPDSYPAEHFHRTSDPQILRCEDERVWMASEYAADHCLSSSIV